MERPLQRPQLSPTPEDGGGVEEERGGGWGEGKLSTSLQYSVGPLDGTGRLARRSGGQDGGTDRAIIAAGTVETRFLLLLDSGAVP